jgi:hypothetical protein
VPLASGSLRTAFEAEAPKHAPVRPGALVRMSQCRRRRAEPCRAFFFGFASAGGES